MIAIGSRDSWPGGSRSVFDERPFTFENDLLMVLLVSKLTHDR